MCQAGFHYYNEISGSGNINKEKSFQNQDVRQRKKTEVLCSMISENTLELRQLHLGNLVASFWSTKLLPTHRVHIKFNYLPLKHLLTVCNSQGSPGTSIGACCDWQSLVASGKAANFSLLFFLLKRRRLQIKLSQSL